MAIWPSSVSTDINLYVAVDFPNSVTALSGAITSSDVTITVTNAINYPTSGGFIFIDSELIYYTGISGNQLTGCLRGQDGTAPASHLNNAVVNLVSVAEHHNALKDEIIAIEASLNLTANKALISNASGRVDVSSVTDTELGYVSGVTSLIQTQLNNKFGAAGTGLTPSGSTISLTVPVSTVNGGTGQISYTDGQLLIGNSSGNTLTKSTLGGTPNQVIVTNGTGSITLSTPQDIAISSSPTFAGETLSVSGTSSTYLTIQNGSVSGSWGVFRSVGVDYFGLGFNGVPTNESNAIFYKSSIGDVVISSPDSHGVTIYAGGGGGQIAMDSMFALTTGVSTIGTNTAPFGNITTKGSLVLQETGVGTASISIISPSSVTTYSLVMPSAQGSLNSVLQNDGSGNLSWSLDLSIDTVTISSFLNLPALSSAPGSPIAGQVYFDTTIPSGTASGSIQVYDGTGWHTVTTV